MCIAIIIISIRRLRREVLKHFVCALSLSLVFLLAKKFDAHYSYYNDWWWARAYVQVMTTICASCFFFGCCNVVCCLVEHNITTVGL